MILEQIELHNYRCFEHVKIPLGNRLNVFVGCNGSGKSTILHAIAACLAPIVARLPMEKRKHTRFLSPGDIFRPWFDVRASFTNILARGRFSELGKPIDWAVGRLNDRSSATVERSTIELGLPPSPQRDLKELRAAVDRIIDDHNIGHPYRLPVFSLYGTSRAIDIPHYRLRPARVPNVFRRLAGLEGALNTSADFRRAVAWFDWLSVRELREKDEGLRHGPLPELEAVRLAISQMIPGISRPRIDAQTGRFMVDTIDAAGRKRNLFLDQLSDGYQVMLGVVMDFALRMAISNPAETPEAVLAQEAILIIDEVDLHLHPSWQQRVIPDLRRTFPNTQLILTTHSPQVATTVPCESLRILRDSRVFGAPSGTDGAESQRLLEDVFGVPARPAEMTATQSLEKYLRLVDEHQWNTPEAMRLRRELDAWSQGQEPRLAEADLQIENLKWEVAG